MTPAGLAQLQTDEGYVPALVYDAFQDTGGVWTIAGGITGPGIGPGTQWAPRQAEAAWVQRVSSTESELRIAFPQFTALETAEPVRADVLVNIAFNIGVHGISKWPVTLAAVWASEWGRAADEIEGNSIWFSQVHARATRCADAMEKGVWA